MELGDVRRTSSGSMALAASGGTRPRDGLAAAWHATHRGGEATTDRGRREELPRMATAWRVAEEPQRCMTEEAQQPGNVWHLKEAHGKLARRHTATWAAAATAQVARGASAGGCGLERQSL